ncbi:MAG: hypothetical protein K9M80_06540 [Candidatus Marinimicrobia bacterium]|nr:hypothetical protein [Candidatus Neomarinimicrobiota bacterium]
MTDDQKKELKILCYAHWNICKILDTETGIRDIDVLKDVISMPGGGSLNCLLGEKLTNKKDLYSQLGWFIYYTIEGEPFNSKNKALIVLVLEWVLNHYNLSHDLEDIAEYVDNIDTMRQGNADISNWFSEKVN